MDVRGGAGEHVPFILAVDGIADLDPSFDPKVSSQRYERCLAASGVRTIQPEDPPFGLR